MNSGSAAAPTPAFSPHLTLYTAPSGTPALSLPLGFRSQALRMLQDALMTPFVGAPQVALVQDGQHFTSVQPERKASLLPGGHCPVYGWVT